MLNLSKYSGLGLLSVLAMLVFNVLPLHAGPVLNYQVTDLGNGLKAYDFHITNDDGLLLSYILAVGFEGVDGATIRQMKAFGAVAVDSETNATNWDGLGSPAYLKSNDTWVYSPFGDNPIAGTNPLTGQPLTGMVEGVGSYALSCYSGGGAGLGNGAKVAHIVSDGYVSWEGTIRRNNVNYPVFGSTQPAATILGDFNGDRTVDLADYTVWADRFGGSDLLLPPGSSNNDGVIDLADYTTWADHFGETAAPVKNYTFLPALDAEWNNTETFDALEPADFDAYWAGKLAALPAADGNWNGGNIDIGGGKFGSGVINWNGATTSAKKPCLIMLPSAGAAPGLGICPNNNNFILASAMGIGNSYRGGTSLGNGEFTEAILAIQQMIRNIKASGKCNGNFFVIGKSQGGGMSLITAGLCPDVRDVFASVPAMTGFTGSGGLTGAWPGYPSVTEAGYLDAVNHAKRITCKTTFSISYNDAVTWGRGQVTAARNTQADTVVNQGWDGHNDDNWWALGTAWLGTLDTTVVNTASTANP